MVVSTTDNCVVVQKFADDLGKSELFLAFFVVFGIIIALIGVLFVVLPKSVRR